MPEEVCASQRERAEFAAALLHCLALPGAAPAVGQGGVRGAPRSSGAGAGTAASFRPTASPRTARSRRSRRPAT